MAARTGWPRTVWPAGGGARSPWSTWRREFHAPDWVLGQSTMAELADGSLVCRMHRDGPRPAGPAPAAAGRPGPARPSAGPGRCEVVDQPCVSIAGRWRVPGRPPPDRVYVLGSTTTEAQAVVEVPLDGAGRPRPPARRPRPVAPVAGGPTSRWPGRSPPPRPDGPVPGLFFAPGQRRARGPGRRRRRPLVVFCHGGPDRRRPRPGFDPVVQFFTSRGLAVAAVDYRGSSGLRPGLPASACDGLWGEADVDDCVAYAAALAAAGWSTAAGWPSGAPAPEG